MRYLSPIISACTAAMLSAALSGCGSPNTMVLDSDIPNISGFEAIVTRDVVRTGGEISSVEVIYRGDVVDSDTNVVDTRSRFIDSGWKLVSEQSRGETTIINFVKSPRWAMVQIALNQIDPMMSPAILRVGTGSGQGPENAGVSPDRTIGPPEGFAPPPFE